MWESRNRQLHFTGGTLILRVETLGWVPWSVVGRLRIQIHIHLSPRPMT